MRILMCLLLLVSVVACRKEHDTKPVEEPEVKKMEWHVYASENYTEPWLDAMTAQVQVRIYKIDTARRTTQKIWDTTFAARTIREYPVLPQKHLLKKEIPHLGSEKLQTWYNIRYEMNGSASEMGQMLPVKEPFTFVDVRI
jgi:hypothetical protein